MRYARSTAAIVIGAMFITACSSAGSSGSGASGSNSGGSKKNLVLITGSQSSAYYITLACGAQQEAAKLGVSLNVQAPVQFEASQQIPLLTAATAKDPSAILIAPVDATALIAPMEQTQAAGVKLVQVDSSVSNTSMVESSVASDNYQGGVVAAQTLAGLIGGKGTVMVVNVVPGLQTTDQRAQGFMAEMKRAYPNIKVLPQQYDNYDPSQAASIVTSTYAAHSDLNGIFAINETTADGVANGVSQASAQGKVKVIAFDASAAQAKALQDGQVQGLIAQEPALIGADGVEQAVAALDGKPVQKTVSTKVIAITKANLKQNQQYVYSSKCG